jgi:hypothetical protein
LVYSESYEPVIVYVVKETAKTKSIIISRMTLNANFILKPFIFVAQYMYLTSEVTPWCLYLSTNKLIKDYANAICDICLNKKLTHDNIFVRTHTNETSVKLNNMTCNERKLKNHHTPLASG